MVVGNEEMEETHMKAVMPSLLPDVAAMRKQSGADRWDETWEGVLHARRFARRLSVRIRFVPARARLEQATRSPYHASLHRPHRLILGQAIKALVG
jgi:hypothetical protein